MTTNIVRRTERSGTSQQAAASVLMENELGVLTDTKKLIVGDGNKAGGYTLTPDNIVAVWPDQADASSPLSLAWWINRANGSAIKLRLPAGVYNVLNDLTIPANVYLEIDKGAVFNVASGKTLTLDCEIGADAQPVFSGGGSVVENYARREVGAEAVGEATVKLDYRKKTKRVYATVAELRADVSNLTIGMTVEIMDYQAGDRLGGVYVVEENPNALYYKDEDDILRLSSTLIGRKQLWGAVISNTVNPVIYPPDKVTKGSIIACALSYLRNQDKLYYGNDYVGDNETNVVANGLADSKYQIDCCSFVDLVSRGVFFENSVYNGLAENSLSQWGFDWTDREHYFYSPSVENGKRMLANDLIYYCYERGYAFKPNAAWNNMETGDLIIFATGSGSPSQTWGGTGHIGMVLGVDLSGVKIIEVQNSGDVVQSVYLSSARKETVSWLARLPYKNEVIHPLAMVDRTEFYTFLAGVWALMPGRKNIELMLNTLTIEDDVELGGRILSCEIYKNTAKIGWMKFSSYARAPVTGYVYDFILPITNFDVTAAALKTAPRYGHALTQFIPST